MRSLMRAAAGAVVIVAAGFLLARSGGHSGSGTTTQPLDQRATAARFGVGYPSNWKLRFATPISGLPLSGALALAPSSPAGAQLVIGTAPASDPSLASEPLVTSGDHSRGPEVVSIGGRKFYRYQGLGPKGSWSLYGLPTTAGTIAALCQAPVGGSSFTANCERVLAGLRPSRGRVLEPSVDVRYALALNGVLTKLNAVRSADGPSLTSRRADVRARAASALAAAHVEAASALRGLSAGAGASANNALSAALTATATAYRDLARAARTHDSAAYAKAQTAIAAATQQLNQAFAQLRRLGYRVQ